jgi:methylated-DNA-[protein]-cysteine S-methyltransferase
VPGGGKQGEKLELLKKEGVLFDGRGYLVDKGRWWDGFVV